ncbi:hypothetical protein DSM110093_02811 [Sulfitobacter sp. DSM 110093]|uniref:hypothetical protein n=1 Tax=Sulfitobacter sp. DSM 110093 TaxID=2883127 RepID=UPI001FAD7A95|nr:hypothetical protein [Sulfitobacter sp. DSM 110093]UOA33001.1 hypothetical protein DSM110093_02811 [Sulfitobacter sp. DSM 110093]
MQNKEVEKLARQAAIRLMQDKGYKVRDVSSGTGVPKNSRLEITDNDGTHSCIMKYTSSGRIHFVREGAGFKVLGDTDFVLIVHAPSEVAKHVVVQLFHSDTVEKAFNAAAMALDEEQQGHVPIWLSPELEEGVRFSGSGFKDRAIWVEQVSLIHSPETVEVNESAVTVVEAETGIMERVKSMLATHMGVEADQLEVDVRIKV